jgi:hypothetical protein
MALVADSGGITVKAADDTILEHELPKVSVLDLRADQLEALERDLKLNVARWRREAPSLALVLAKVGAMATGEPLEDWRHMTLRELMDRVDIEGDETDPKRPSEPIGSLD